MAGAARSKIDRETMQLFDPEVDAPDHDKVLTTIFQSDDRLRKLIAQLHGNRTLLLPGPDTLVQVEEIGIHPGAWKPRMVKFSEAVEMAEGVAPTWKTSEPVRDLKKRLEVPLFFSTSGRSSRIMGFADMLLEYWIPAALPHLEQQSTGRYRWAVNKQFHHVVVEVKSKWPTAGNLLRQLNLYSRCSADAEGYRKQLVIGPDDTMKDLLNEHGWRLLCFNPDLSVLQLCAGPKAVVSPPSVPNAF